MSVPDRISVRPVPQVTPPIKRFKRTREYKKMIDLERSRISPLSVEKDLSKGVVTSLIAHMREHGKIDDERIITALLELLTGTGSNSKFRLISIWNESRPIKKGRKPKSKFALDAGELVQIEAYTRALFAEKKSKLAIGVAARDCGKSESTIARTLRKRRKIEKFEREKAALQQQRYSVLKNRLDPEGRLKLVW